MRVSIKDIAQALNLSKATISWILSGQGEAKGFSETTIKRVKEYAESVNYRPNLLARSLSLGTSNIMGLIIPFLSDTYYASLAGAIEKEATRRKYSLVVCSSEGDGEKEYELVRNLKATQVDGIILAPTKTDKRALSFLQNDSLPFVLVDRYYPNIQSNYVIVNNREACYQVVRHLGEIGARKIALLTTDMHLYVMKQRVEGYRNALQDLGVEMNLSLELCIDRKTYQTDIINKLDGLFQEVPDVDGFFFATHYLAIEAIRYFIRHGINYRERFHMGCFHETEALDILAPEISISRMPLAKIGTTAVDILLANIQEKDHYTYQNVIIENEFLPEAYIKRFKKQ